MTEQPPIKYQPELNWELLGEIVDFMQGRRGADVIQLMSRLTETDLDACSLDFQRRFWVQMVIADHEEALNYRGLYLNRPFAMDILKRIALEEPFMIIRKNLYDPENALYQKLRLFLTQELGKEKIDELVKARENTFFRRLFRKIFGEDEQEQDPKSTFLD